MDRPDDKLRLCAINALDNRNPFHVLYSGPLGFFQHAYGLAGDAEGNVYEVLYDSRGLLNLGLGKNSRAFNENRIRVTTCLKPIRLGTAGEGIPACITPVDERQSKLVAQERPIDTTVCAIVNHPATFNNRMVRIHGDVLGNFEYSCFRQLDLAPFDLLFWPHLLVNPLSAPGRSEALRRP
jgi:hypothetical protein